MQGLIVIAALGGLAIFLLVIGWGWNRFTPGASTRAERDEARRASPRSQRPPSRRRK